MLGDGEFDFDSSTNSSRREFLSQFKLVQARKVNYGENGVAKPILIIYNPHSGKKTNLVPMIEARLTKEGIPFEFMPTR